MKIVRNNGSQVTGEVISAHIEVRGNSKIIACLSENGQNQDVLAAFVSGNPDELPAGCRLKERIESLAGKGRSRSFDLKHLSNGDLVYELVRRKDVGASPSCKLMYESIDQTSLILQNLYDEKVYEGKQLPAFSGAIVRDLYDVGAGCSLMGPPYKWSQYSEDIPDATLKRLYYDQPLHGLEDDGTKVGDVIQIDDVLHRPLVIVSGFTALPAHEIVLCGEKGDIPVRTSMGVSFVLSRSPLSNREAITGCNNPSLETCHGFVVAISDSDGMEVGGIFLTVRIALARDNLPSYCKWRLLPCDAVFQTNLQVTIPAASVVSVFRILPLPLHSMAGFRPRDDRVLGAKPSRPIERDVYVAAHLEFALGRFEQDEVAGALSARSVPGIGPQVSWVQRYEKSSFKALALLHDFCARGGKITDGDFRSHHAAWKEMYLKSTSCHQGGRHLPTVALNRVACFPSGAALSTISQNARLISIPIYGTYLFTLHLAIRRCAEAKAKRAKFKPSTSVSVDANIPGAMLLQLVHKYVAGTEAQVYFREGMVDAVVENLKDARCLIGSEDGRFDLDGAGIVEFHGPVTFRWVLYQAKRNAEDSTLFADGNAEVIFSRYVAMDRHGGELTGDIDGGPLPQAPGGGGGGGKRFREDGGGGDEEGSKGECQAPLASFDLLLFPLTSLVLRRWRERRSKRLGSNS
jgi:hypothetical protein